MLGVAETNDVLADPGYRYGMVPFAPRGMTAEDVGRAILAVPSVVQLHDLHVWTITSGFPALSAHVLVDPGADCHAIRRQIEAVLRERFELEHTTLQVDHAGLATTATVELRRL